MAEHRGPLAEHRGPLVEHRAPEGVNSPQPEKGPSGSQVVAVLTLFPIGGILLAFSGITLAGTVIGLAVATPLFVIFSPVLIPAAILIVLAVTGFLTSGAFGVTALTSLTWVVKFLREARKKVPEHMEMTKRRAVEAAERAKEAGQQMQSRAQEGAKT